MADIEKFQMPQKVRYDQAKMTGTYGQFIAEPLEQGFGTTLGNALRRVLLSSIEGAAITWIRIEGVEHEFLSIPGVVEDATDLILNLKEVRLKFYTDEPKRLWIRTKGPGEVTAGDIEAGDVEIMNPALHIATIDPGGKFIVEMNARKGRGYVPSEKNKENQIGVIPIDAVFSPVRKVNFTVENARVGQRTDYDKLILEVTTDGSIRPDEAVAYAAKLLKDHLSIFMPGLKEEKFFIPVEEEAKEEAPAVNENLFKSTDEIEFSLRATNGLMNAGITTIAELVQRTESDLLRTRNFGRKSLNEIKEILAEMDLSLGMSVEDWIVAEAKRRAEKKPAA